jgi:hypothetical protein
MKKYLLILTVATLVVPSVAFASWWNPLTWNIFSPHQLNLPVQIIRTTTPPDQIFTDTSTTTATTTISIATTTEVIIATTSIPKINVPVKKVTKKVVLPAVISSPVSQVQTPVVSNYSDAGSTVCPLGYTCAPIVQTTTSATPQPTPITASPTLLTDQQICVNSYGQNSVYTGNKNSNGGPVCGCANGYGWNNGQTSCQLQQPIQQSSTQTTQTNATQVQTYQPPVVPQPPQIISPLPVPQGPTPEQQAACQQAYDLGVASLQLGYQSQSAQIEAKYQQDLANQQNSNSWSYGGGERAIEQGLANTRDWALSSLTAQYGVSLSNEKMALQKCLNN